jgi:hypothetical protein
MTVSGSGRAVLAVLAALLFSPAGAKAQVLRYSKTTTGGLTSAGNTLGLSKQMSANGPGTRDSIGTFLAVSATSVDDNPLNLANPWPAGTTWDWTKNGSTSGLTFPGDSQVLYAELVWAGSYNYVADVTSFLDNAVTLSVSGQSVQVTPDAATAVTIAQISATGFAANYYLRSANVTSFVAQNGSGSYTVSGVPATEDAAINSLNAAGWSLVVAYYDSNEPVRNLTVFVGGSFVDETRSRTTIQRSVRHQRAVTQGHHEHARRRRKPRGRSAAHRATAAGCSRRCRAPTTQPRLFIADQRC